MDYIKDIYEKIVNNKGTVTQLVMCNYIGYASTYRPAALNMLLASKYSNFYSDTSIVTYMDNSIALEQFKKILDEIESIFGVFYFTIRSYPVMEKINNLGILQSEFENNILNFSFKTVYNDFTTNVESELEVNNGVLYLTSRILNNEVSQVYISEYECTDVFSYPIYYNVEKETLQCLYANNRALLKTTNNRDIAQYLNSYVNEKGLMLTDSLLIPSYLSIKKEQLTINRVVSSKIKEKHEENILNDLNPIVTDFEKLYSDEQLNVLYDWVKNEDNYNGYMSDEEYNLLRSMFTDIDKTLYRGILMTDFDGKHIMKYNELDSWTYDIEIAKDFMDFAYSGHPTETLLLMEVEGKRGLDINRCADIETVLTFNSEKEVIMEGSSYEVISQTTGTYIKQDKEFQYVHAKVKPVEFEKKILKFG